MKPLSPAGVKIRILLLKRGMQVSDLAKELGISLRTAQCLIANILSNSKLRRQAELFFEEPIWASEAEFYRHNSVAEHIGLDPVIATWSELFLRSKQVGLDRAATHLRGGRTSIVTALVGHIARMRIAGEEVPPATGFKSRWTLHHLVKEPSFDLPPPAIRQRKSKWTESALIPATNLQSKESRKCHEQYHRKNHQFTKITQ